jgi:hypothetical protein
MGNFKALEERVRATIQRRAAAINMMRSTSDNRFSLRYVRAKEAPDEC